MHNLGSLDVLFSRLLMLNILYIFSGTSLPNSLCTFVLQANVYPRLWNWSCLFVSYQFISTFFFSLFNHCTSLPQADVYSGPWLLSLLFQSNPQENPGHGEEPKILCHVWLYCIWSCLILMNPHWSFITTNFFQLNFRSWHSIFHFHIDTMHCNELMTCALILFLECTAFHKKHLMSLWFFICCHYIAKFLTFAFQYSK